MRIRRAVLPTFFFAVAAAAASLHVSAENRFSSPQSAASANTLTELQRRELALASAPIKSAADLTAYLAAAGNRTTPFTRMSDAARGRFIQSITFNENGITGFSYQDIQSEMSPTEIYQLLSLFGAQHVTPLIRGAIARTALDRAIMAGAGKPSSNTGGGIVQPSLAPAGGDHEGYQCVSRATCYAATSYICMSTC